MRCARAQCPAEEQKKLTSVLTYYRVSRKLMVSNLIRRKTVKTVQGQEIRIDGFRWHISKYPKVNNVKTVKTDIEATNRVIHALDTVLMPK